MYRYAFNKKSLYCQESYNVPCTIVNLQSLDYNLRSTIYNYPSSTATICYNFYQFWRPAKSTQTSAHFFFLHKKRRMSPTHLHYNDFNSPSCWPNFSWYTVYLLISQTPSKTDAVLSLRTSKAHVIKHLLPLVSTVVPFFAHDTHFFYITFYLLLISIKYFPSKSCSKVIDI